MFGSPSDPSDGLVELEAEDRFNFKERLIDIKMSTLVIGGENRLFLSDSRDSCWNSICQVDSL
jgi:hypothetical protein